MIRLEWNDSWRIIRGMQKCFFSVSFSERFQSRSPRCPRSCQNRCRGNRNRLGLLFQMSVRTVCTITIDDEKNFKILTIPNWGTKLQSSATSDIHTYRHTNIQTEQKTRFAGGAGEQWWWTFSWLFSVHKLYARWRHKQVRREYEY